MTEKEAIQQLEFDREMILFDPTTGENMTLEVVKALNKDNYFTYLADGIAILALKEIQQYREIGTVEECREAVEKQKAKKPVCVPKPYNEEVGFNDEWHCPSCGSYIGYFTEGMNEPEQMEYCNECGQHIARDWSEE